MEPDLKTNRNVGDYIKQIGAYGILLTVFAIGVAVAGAIWSSTIADLNNQLGYSRIELKNSTEELDQVKSDYLTYKTLHEDNSVGSPISQPGNLPTRPLDTLSKPGKTEIQTIDTEKSYTFFGGDLTISLIAVPFGGNPLRYTVVANISSPTGKVTKIDNQDIGSVFNYSGKKNYKITILEVETFSATFKVSSE